MKRYEYRIEPMVFTLGSSKQDQMLEALNRFGREGWRLNRTENVLFGLPPLSWKGGIMLLLEREIADRP
ncbi:MAG: hypothetical protein HGB17_16105 [Syntrophobacteraceae bacterium]|nr:hypothetical protein [Syntrophobacteraceae bacterium]